MLVWHHQLISFLSSIHSCEREGHSTHISAEPKSRFEPRSTSFSPKIDAKLHQLQRPFELLIVCHLPYENMPKHSHHSECLNGVWHSARLVFCKELPLALPSAWLYLQFHGATLGTQAQASQFLQQKAFLWSQQQNQGVLRKPGPTSLCPIPVRQMQNPGMLWVGRDLRCHLVPTSQDGQGYPAHPRDVNLSHNLYFIRHFHQSEASRIRRQMTHFWITGSYPNGASKGTWCDTSQGGLAPKPRAAQLTRCCNEGSSD